MTARVFRSAAGRERVHERYRWLLRDSPVKCESIRVPTREGDTFVLACGPIAAQPLVLFHGGATTSAMWLRSLEAWAPVFRIYAVDMIGEPGFSAPSRPPLVTDAHAAWLDDVWNALQLGQASVAGASQGGWLALDYAIRRPGRVQRLALLAPGGIGSQRVSIVFKVGPLLLMGRWGRRKAIELAMGYPAGEMPAGDRTFMDFFELTQEHFVLRTKALPVFTDAMLRTLDMPVMAILGGRDIIFDSAQTRQRLQSHVPQSQIHYLPEAGHGLGDSTAAVLEFLLTS